VTNEGMDVARRMWTLFEPVHAVTYFAPGGACRLRGRRFARSLVLRASLDSSRELLQPARGWTDEQWDAATTRLAELLTPVVQAAHRLLPHPNPIGLPQPAV
jgi:hypothetical protein